MKYLVSFGLLLSFSAPIHSATSATASMGGIEYFSTLISLADKDTSGDGAGMAIIGLSLFVLTLASWFISPFLGIFATVPLSIIGLLLSIFGLRRARKRWYQTKTIRILSILGIVLNGLLLIGGFWLLLGIFS
ncbi:MAG: hypothetical protein JNN28_00215 [Saprospiraceae bacterium]|nr:hypothetical protein [Saprospiraceae bacterium]